MRYCYIICCILKWDRIVLNVISIYGIIHEYMVIEINFITTLAAVIMQYTLVQFQNYKKSSVQ